jgi:hypothetical protein
MFAAGCGRPPAESNSAIPENVPPPASSLLPAAVAPATDNLPLAIILVKILDAAQRTGSIVEHCHCSAGARMEEVHLVPAEVAQQPLEKAMQSIELHYPEVRWSGAAHDRIRVLDSAATPGLLKVKIKEFLVVEDRPPQASLPALFRTAEVASYMRKHRMRLAPSTQSTAKLSRISPSIIQTKNATLAEILDRMVEGYRSASGRPLYRAWSYRECRRNSKTLVEIGIF